MRTKYLRSFFHFFSASFINRSISLIRELLLAWLVGPSKILDIFFFLISIPNLVNYTWNKALETALQKHYEYTQNSQDTSSANIDIFSHLRNLIKISFSLYILLSISFPIIIFYFYQGYFSENIILAIALINSVFIIETYFLGYKIIKYSQQKFFTVSILPVIQNLIILFGIVFGYKNLTIQYLSILYAIGGITQFFIIFFWKKSKVISAMKKLSLKDSKIILKDGSQLALASGLSSLNMFVDQNFALSLGANANSYIHYGQYFLTIYLVLFVRNINTIFYPQFQKYIVQKKQDKLENDARKIIKIILMLSIVLIILLINNGFYTLKLILGHGKVSLQDISNINACTLAYSGAFLGTAFNAIIVRILHALSQYQVIVRVAVVNFLVNILFNFIFIKLFGIWGIALSTSLTFILIVSIYLIHLKKKFNINLFDIESGWLSRFLSAIALIFTVELVYVFNTNELFTVALGDSLIIFIVSNIILIIIFSAFRLINIKKIRIIF